MMEVAFTWMDHGEEKTCEIVKSDYRTGIKTQSKLDKCLSKKRLGKGTYLGDRIRSVKILFCYDLLPYTPCV